MIDNDIWHPVKPKKFGSRPTVISIGDGFTQGVDYSTTTHDTHSDRLIIEDKLMKQNKYAKYKALKQVSPMILSFDDNVPLQYQINMDFEVTNDLSRPTTAESENVTVKENITAGGVFKGQYEPYFTESSLVLGKSSSKRDIERFKQEFNMNAPIAMGRSGRRIEKGLSTTGLSGERLMAEGIDRSKNSLIQRTWLPTEDPALTYRIKGIPPAAPATGLSLPIGPSTDIDPNSHYIKAGANYKRRYFVNNGPLSRGRPVGEVFRDDFGLD